LVNALQPEPSTQAPWTRAIFFIGILGSQVWRARQNGSTEYCGEYGESIDGQRRFGIGRSLHQRIPLSVRACHVIVSMLSSDCHYIHRELRYDLTLARGLLFLDM
jgi:hypothetical protein